MIKLLKSNLDGEGGGVSKPSPALDDTSREQLSPPNSVPTSPTTLSGFGFGDGTDNTPPLSPPPAPVQLSRAETSAAAATLPKISAMSRSTTTNTSTSTHTSAREWTCATCGRNNGSTAMSCRICTAKRPPEKGYWEKQAEEKTTSTNAAAQAVALAKKLAAMHTGANGDGAGAAVHDDEDDDEEDARVAFEQALVRRASLRPRGGGGGGGGGGSKSIGMPGMAVGGLTAATLPAGSASFGGASTTVLPVEDLSNVSTVAELMSGWDAPW